MQFSRFPKRTNTRDHPLAFGIATIESFECACLAGESEEFLIPWDTYTYFCIEQGSGEITIDLEQSRIEDHCIYFLKPGQAFSAILHEPAKGFIISFAKEFIDFYDKAASDFNQNVFLNYDPAFPVVRIDKETYEIMKNIANKMLQEFQSQFTWRGEVLKGFLKIFMIYFNRQLECNLTTMSWSRKIELANRFFSLLEKNYTSKKLVRDYAELLAVTPGYLNVTVKEVSGFAASHHIQQRIVLQAKRMAAFESDSMKEIAYYLGFEDPAHFSKYFKNFSGLNFRDFKRASFTFI
jgi:AraC family transcriptional activator of pobA